MEVLTLFAGIAVGLWMGIWYCSTPTDPTYNTTSTASEVVVPSEPDKVLFRNADSEVEFCVGGVWYYGSSTVWYRCSDSVRSNEYEISRIATQYYYLKKSDLDKFNDLYEEVK
ncbi:hypothetical protein NVP1031O_085 [Vibrio phage 1.031.O._10N.261.46.F8]|nr:hypothetical protein NVP1031O_085 [Vibrio phage 1.031.O._10N.261.46.F8]